MEGIITAVGEYPPDGKPYTAIIAIDRQAIIEFFDKCEGRKRKYGRSQDYAFGITMPCGYYKKIARHDDIPFEDLPCPCGAANRYLIRYGKE